MSAMSRWRARAREVIDASMAATPVGRGDRGLRVDRAAVSAVSAEVGDGSGAARAAAAEGRGLIDSPQTGRQARMRRFAAAQ
mgnify:CR=1 FL=1